MVNVICGENMVHNKVSWELGRTTMVFSEQNKLFPSQFPTYFYDTKTNNQRFFIHLQNCSIGQLRLQCFRGFTSIRFLYVHVVIWNFPEQLAFRE